MTVSSETFKATGTGNGSGTVFSFSPIIIHKAEDLLVTHKDADGTETVLTEGSGAANYSISITTYPATGSITYPADAVTPMASTETVTMTRSLELKQETDLVSGGGYFPEVQEKEFDRHVMLIQQLQEQLDRVLQAAVSDDDVDMTLPTAEDRANLGLLFDATGKPIAGTIATTAVSTFIATLLDDLTAAAARTTLDAAQTMRITDDDDDTYVDVEKSADEDVIRFYTAGVETLSMSLAQMTLHDEAATASSGPTLNLTRNSASPADNDIIGAILFNGEAEDDSEQTYARIDTEIVDATQATEDARLRFHTMAGGASTTRMYVQDGMYMDAATGGDQGSDTINASAYYDDGVLFANAKSATQTLSTGTPTAVVFGSITAGAKRITLYFQGASHNGSTDGFAVQLGDAGGMETSGYAGARTAASTTAAWGGTLAELTATSLAAAKVFAGVVELVHQGSNVWSIHATTARTDSGGSDAVVHSMGTKTLTAELTQIQIMTTGSDTFDAGTANIMVES